MATPSPHDPGGSTPASPATFGKAFKSRGFVFVIGPTAEEYLVHQDIFSQLSAPLKALTTSGMSESVEARVVWEDVEPKIFELLLEFAYKGRVRLPVLHTRPHTHGGKHHRFAHCQNGGSALSGVTHKFSSPTIPDFNRTQFHGDSLDVRAATLAPGALRDALVDSIKLYILAGKYLIGRLTEDCAKMFHHCLAYMDVRKLSDASFQEFLEAIAFLWTHTNDIQAAQIRDLARDYMVLSHREMRKRPEFAQWVKENGTLAAEILLALPDSLWTEG